MSKNRNRKKLDKAMNSKEYNVIMNLMEYPPYCEYDVYWKHGDLPNYKFRAYKTWKHNRKKQYK